MRPYPKAKDWDSKIAIVRAGGSGFCGDECRIIKSVVAVLKDASLEGQSGGGTKGMVGFYN